MTSNLSPKQRDIGCNVGVVRERRQEAFQAEKLICESAAERELSTSGNRLNAAWYWGSWGGLAIHEPRGTTEDRSQRI